jgi:hypothetical protein
MRLLAIARVPRFMPPLEEEGHLKLENKYESTQKAMSLPRLPALKPVIKWPCQQIFPVEVVGDSVTVNWMLAAPTGKRGSVNI